jgi:RNA polymerase sigma factor (sigma-70 family)
MDLDAETVFLTGALPASTPDNSRVSNPAWESYYADLRKFVSRQLGGRQDTDDVVQEIYREVLHSRCSEVTNPRAWIWKIAWRVVNDAFQREKQHRLHHVAADPKVIEALACKEHCVTPSIDTQLEARDEILAALNALPLATQIAIIRSRCDGWTYEKIAVELGVTPHMVKKHIVRAIAHFDAYLEQTEAKDAKQGVGK